MSRRSYAAREGASRRSGRWRRSPRRPTCCAEHDIGALVVSDDGETVDGIVSERDIVFGLHRYGAGLLSQPVAEVMTHAVVTCEPNDSIAELMAEMTNRRIRHFPVVRNDRLCGIVSIGDLVKSRLDEIEYEATSLRSFIAGA